MVFSLFNPLFKLYIYPSTDQKNAQNGPMRKVDPISVAVQAAIFKVMISHHFCWPYPTKIYGAKLPSGFLT